MRAALLSLALLLITAGVTRAGDAEAVPHFAEAVEAASNGKALPKIELDDDAVARLRSLATDPAASDRSRAVACALLGTVAPPTARQFVDSILGKARADRDATATRSIPPPSQFLKGEGLTVEHVPPLAYRAFGERDLLAVAALGWIPGREAALVTLAFVPNDHEGEDGTRLLSLRVRARRFPEERPVLLGWARKREPLDPQRSLLLAALIPFPDEGITSATVESIEAATAAPQPPGPATIALFKSLGGTVPRDLRLEPRFPPPVECGPALARLVERWPDLIRPLEHSLSAVSAPVSKALLWSRLGSHEADEAIVKLLLPRLDATDEAPLLAALALPRTAERYFYLRLDLATYCPGSLRTAALHDALWAIAESVDRERGRAGGDVTTVKAVLAIERFQDAKDTARLDRLVGIGSLDTSTEALREILRRAGDPATLFFATLGDEDPGRREAAQMAVLIDFQSSKRLPIPRTPKNWDRVIEVLQHQIEQSGDAVLRVQREALRAASTVRAGLAR